jgi:hypothetical protein
MSGAERFALLGVAYITQGVLALAAAFTLGRKIGMRRARH